MPGYVTATPEGERQVELPAPGGLSCASQLLLKGQDWHLEAAWELASEERDWGVLLPAEGDL